MRTGSMTAFQRGSRGTTATGMIAAGRTKGAKGEEGAFTKEAKLRSGVGNGNLSDFDSTHDDADAKTVQTDADDDADAKPGDAEESRTKKTNKAEVNEREWFGRDDKLPGALVVHKTWIVNMSDALMGLHDTMKK